MDTLYDQRRIGDVHITMSAAIQKTYATTHTQPHQKYYGHMHRKLESRQYNSDTAIARTTRSSLAYL